MNTKTPIKIINTAAFLFLVLGITSMSPLAQRAAAQKTPPAPQDVRVTNTAAEPVPVKIDATTNTVKAGQSGAWNVGITGTPSVSITSMPSVSITGTPSVSITGTPSVSIAGTPSVSIAGTPSVTLSGASTVQIGNPATSPALVRDVSFAQPFRVQVSSIFTNGSADTTPNNSATVPAGKRLIVEFVTVQIILLSGQVALLAKLDTPSFDQVLTLTPVSATLFVATHKVFVIYDANTVVQATAFRNVDVGGGSLIMTISGYLQDII